MQVTILTILSMLPYALSYALSTKEIERRFRFADPIDSSLSTAPSHSISIRQHRIHAMSWGYVLIWLGEPLVLGIAGAVGLLGLTTLIWIYKSILDSLRDWVIRSPPLGQIHIEAGSLRWELGCTVEGPMFWEFVEDYTKSKLDAVNRGFAEVYAKEWYFSTSDRKRICYAGMRLAREGETTVPPS